MLVGGPDADGRDRGASWRRKLVKAPVAAHERTILDLLADGRARTFNAIGVEAYDKTADMLYRTPVEEALWSLVEREALEHTLLIPIRFRLRSE